MHCRRVLARWMVVSLTLVVWACDRAPRRIGDLDMVRASGELRVIVRPGFMDSPVHTAGRIDERSLVQHLAARLGVRLRWVQARRHDQVLPWLVEGVGDLAVSRFSPASLHREDVVGSAALDWVEDLVVAGRGCTRVSSIDDIALGRLHLHRSASWVLELGADLPVAPVADLPEELTVERALQRVRSGRYGMTVVDSAVLEAVGSGAGLRVLGPVAERRPLVWAVRSDNRRLRAAVDDFVFAEQVLARTTRTTSCRDLDQVRAAGVLRLVTRNSPTTCSIERGGIEGFEYDLALDLCRRLKVRLELEIPPPGVDPLDWLEQGYGDVAALHEPADPEREGMFLVTSAYRYADLVSVTSRRTTPPESIEDLAGAVVAASAPVASLCRLLPIDPPMAPVRLDRGADALTALLEVSRGNVRVAVVDTDTARIELAHRPELQQGAVVLPNVGLVWVLNPSAQRLYRVVDAFLNRARTSGLTRQLARSDLGTWKPYVPPYLPEVPEGDLSPYDELLKWEGRRQGIDWRLLASLMYEESRFDPYAVGPGGSAGLFQFMAGTWRELGVEDPHHPAEAVEAGARYLKKLMDSFGDLNMADRVAMGIASYNVGPRHVYDARRLAVEMGLDPDSWSGGVETALLIIDNAEVARRFPAGVCRCRRAVGYTRRILRRYRAYTEQFPPA